MAPRELPTEKPKEQRTLVKANTARKPLISTTASAIKKTMSAKKTTEKTPSTGIANKVTVEARVRTNTVPKVSTPKPKESKSVPLPGTVKKNAKKSWKRRPKPAHSGVPVPEKMRRLLEKQFLDSDCSFDF